MKTKHIIYRPRKIRSKSKQTLASKHKYKQLRKNVSRSHSRKFYGAFSFKNKNLESHLSIPRLYRPLVQSKPSRTKFIETTNE